MFASNEWWCYLYRWSLTKFSRFFPYLHRYKHGQNEQLGWAQAWEDHPTSCFTTYSNTRLLFQLLTIKETASPLHWSSIVHCIANFFFLSLNRSNHSEVYHFPKVVHISSLQMPVVVRWRSSSLTNTVSCSQCGWNSRKISGSEHSVPQSRHWYLQKTCKRTYIYMGSHANAGKMVVVVLLWYFTNKGTQCKRKWRRNSRRWACNIRYRN